MDAFSDDDDFQVFWENYPKKRAKHDARKAWDKLNPSSDLLLTILKAVDAYKQTYEWRKNQGQYIPYAATFIRGRRWEDERPTAPGVRRWTCPHEEHCGSPYQCHLLIEIAKQKQEIP